MPDPSFFFPLLLQSVLIPAAVALASMLLLSASHRSWPAPLAIAAGFLASYAATFHAQWSFPPHQALDWLPLVIALALGAIVVERNGALAMRQLLSLVVSAVVVWPALPSVGASSGVLMAVVSAGLITAAWAALAATTARQPAVSFMLAMVAGGAGLALMIDASQLLGQLCGALGVAILACGLLRRGFGPAAIGLATLLLGALLAYAHIYAGFGLPMVLLLTAALLAGATAMHLLPGPRAWLAAPAVAALPVLAVLGLAVKAMQDSGGY